MLVYCVRYFLYLENASLLQDEIKRQPAMIDRIYGRRCNCNALRYNIML